MSTQHIVTGALVKVSIGSPSGNRVARLVRRGDVVPDGVAEEQLQHLIDRGLIAEVEISEAEEETPRTVFSQQDIDDAVKAAVDAKDAELEQARTDLQAKEAELEQATAALDAAKAEAGKAPAGEPAKGAPRKQS